MRNSFSAKRGTVSEYKRYSNQILLDTYDIIIASKEAVATQALLCLQTNEYYYHLEYTQQIITNFLFFGDYDYLDAYLEWRYRLYEARGIELEFLILESEELQKTTLHYIRAPFSQDIVGLHAYIAKFYGDMIGDTSQRASRQIEPQTQKLYLISLEGDVEEFVEVLRENAPTLEAFCDFFTSQVSKVLALIGTEWQNSVITVAQEHRATALIRDAVYAHLERFASKEPRGQKFFIGSVAGEQHSFGLELTSKILHHLGYEVATLGSKFSKEEVVSALYEFEPQHLLFVLTLPTSLMSVAELIAQIRTEDLPTRPKCYVAGQALSTLSNAYASLECDYYFADFIDFYRKFSS